MRLFSLIIFFVSCLDAGVLINEIMYNPPGNDDFEWIELYNTSSNSVSLDGWNFKKGIKFSFSAEHQIPPYGYLVLARNPSAFTSAYPYVVCSGEYNGKLSNKGEKIVLENSLGERVDEVEYGVGGVWPEAAFNGGASLERISIESPADSPYQWLPSHNISSWYFIEKTVKI